MTPPVQLAFSVTGFDIYGSVMVGDSGVSGVAALLVSTGSGHTIDQFTTSETGSFVFSGVAMGSYVVRFQYEVCQRTG